MTLPIGMAFGIPLLWDLSRPAQATALEAPWPLDQPIRVCVIRVQFVPDELTGTSGTGRFNERALWPDTLRIDPWPHDSSYFADHIRFVAHYCSTLSGGRTTIGSWSIYPPGLDTAYTLPNPMWHYNYNTDQELLNQRLVELFVESIEASNTGDIDYGRYDAFLIFHAGVGKDFSFGYDETPFDIPSAYISSRDLEGYRGRLPVEVTRGVILPEAENQKEALDFGVELSLNGIAVKLFGNWLGLPDLFDTQTGRSGVGRWGMMDQGSGNVNAMVPAAPDAWSRSYLGWDTPQVMILNNDTADAAATWSLAIDASRGVSPVRRIPVTPREYYLIENRKTSADSNGCCAELFDRDGRRMRMETDGDIVEVDEGFKVAVRAAQYDIGVPGSGLLIWHIDEDVIAAGLESNSVNSNREHRGVDLVEADGSQDIGHDFGFGSAGSGTSLGIAEDAWYRDNRNHRDANNRVIVEFANNTAPPARLYDGAYTYLSLTDFSTRSDTMTFQARMTLTIPGSDLLVPKRDSTDRIVYITADLEGDGFPEIVAQRTGLSSDSFAFIGFVDRPDTFIASGGLRPGSIVAVDIDRDGKEEIIGGIPGVIEDSSGTIISRRISDAPRSLLDVFPAETETGQARLLSVEFTHDNQDYRTIWAVAYDLFPNRLDSLQIFGPGEIGTSVSSTNVEAFPAHRFIVSTSFNTACVEINDEGLHRLWSIQGASLTGSTVVVNAPDRSYVWLDGLGYFTIDTGELLCDAQECIAPQVDWDTDGIVDGGGPEGRASAPREDIPSLNRESLHYVDIDADGSPDLVGFDEYRLSVALHVDPSPNGFPVAVPGSGNRELIQYLQDPALEFVTVYEDSAQFALRLNRLPVIAGSAERFKFEDEKSIINVGPRRPQVHDREEWVYCWPNPTADISYIRVTRSHPAAAEVRVFDLAGRLVAELSGSSDMAGPFEIPWNVGGVESGVYIGRVEVNGGGQSDSREIKIAVVK